MEDESSDSISWKVLGVISVVVFGLVFGVIYAEYIQTDSEEINQYNQTDTVQTNEHPNQPPTAEFDATYTSGEAPLEVTFDASDSFDEDGDINNYDWYFGGSTASGETATFTYESSGNYSAKLVVEDDDGATDSFSREIKVTSGEPEDATDADEENSSSESSGDEWFSYSEYADIDEEGGDGEEENEGSTKEEEGEPLSSYDIVEEKDISVEYDGEMAKRKRYSIVVGTEVEREQIKPTVKKIISDIREESEEIDSIHLFLYTTESRVGGAYDVAMADWAPDGEVSNLTGRIVSENIRDDYEIKVEIKENLEEYLRKIKERDIKFGLTVEERKDFYQEIVRCEDKGDVESSKYYDPMCSKCPEYREEDWQAKGDMSNEIIRSCKRELRNEYGIIKSQQEKIGNEGLEKNWPMPEPLPFADCCDY